jgi:hypothetical protein
MDEFVGKHDGVADVWDERARHECCGDYVFAMALKNITDLEVKQVWPTINGEKPSTLPFGPSHWCHPIVTMHHMNSEEISSFWEFESRRYAAQSLPSAPGPLRIKDIYHEFFEPKLVETRDDWDNLADDVFYLNATARNYEDWELGRTKKEKDMSDEEKSAHLSFNDCRLACETLKDCFQYRYQNGICGTSYAFKLGKPVKKEKEDKDRWFSGWDVDKINNFIEEQGECGKVRWPGS